MYYAGSGSASHAGTDQRPGDFVGVSRQTSNEEAPFTMSDLQSDLSNVSDAFHDKQSRPSQDIDYPNNGSHASADSLNAIPRNTAHQDELPPNTGRHHSSRSHDAQPHVQHLGTENSVGAATSRSQASQPDLATDQSEIQMLASESAASDDQHKHGYSTSTGLHDTTGASAQAVGQSAPLQQQQASTGDALAHRGSVMSVQQPSQPHVDSSLDSQQHADPHASSADSHVRLVGRSSASAADDDWADVAFPEDVKPPADASAHDDMHSSDAAVAASNRSPQAAHGNASNSLEAQSARHMPSLSESVAAAQPSVQQHAAAADIAPEAHDQPDKANSSDHRFDQDRTSFRQSTPAPSASDGSEAAVHAGTSAAADEDWADVASSEVAAAAHDQWAEAAFSEAAATDNSWADAAFSEAAAADVVHVKASAAEDDEWADAAFSDAAASDAVHSKTSAAADDEWADAAFSEATAEAADSVRQPQGAGLTSDQQQPTADRALLTDKHGKHAEPAHQLQQQQQQQLHQHENVGGSISSSSIVGENQPPQASTQQQESPDSKARHGEDAGAAEQSAADGDQLEGQQPTASIQHRDTPGSKASFGHNTDVVGQKPPASRQRQESPGSTARRGEDAGPVAQSAAGDDWDNDDGFGDFNDAAGQGGDDENGFGDFNEADTGPAVDQASTAPDNETQQQQQQQALVAPTGEDSG